MKSVVMIAYSFPPEGNAGTYRPLRFVRHLPKIGWHPTVISVDTNSYERYDPGLLTLVPSETEIRRVRQRDPWQAIQARRAQRIKEKFFSRTSTDNGARHPASYHTPVRSLLREAVRTVEAWCYNPDMCMGWIRPAMKATAEICERNQSNVILATGPPWSSFIVAQRASQSTGVPYVLDFRASWTLVPSASLARRPAWAKRQDRQILYRLFKGARAVIFFSETEAECYWRAYRDVLDVSRIHIIPNGYDGRIEDFAAPDGDKCTILYTGTLPLHRYDTLLQALHQIKKSDPAKANQLRLRFFSDGVEGLAEQVAVLGLSDIVEAAGPTSHAEVNRLQHESHALLMLGVAETVKGNEIIVGSKLFGYLKAGRPILGILPPGEAKKVLQRVGASTIADVNSASEIIHVLQRVFEAWAGGTLPSLLPNRAACEVYSAEQQTSALVCALEGGPPVDPFIPGSVEIPASLRGDIAMKDGCDGRRV